MGEFKLKRFRSIVVLGLILMLSACAEAPAPQAEQTASKSLVIAAGRDFWQGPNTAIYLHGSTNVWESLVMLDDAMKPVMLLAQSVTASEDGHVWTVKLRENVLFHDGSNLDAETAAYNLGRLYRFNAAAQAYDPAHARTGEFGEIAGIEVIDETTFTVTHARPVPDFDARLSYENSSMFAMASFDGAGVIQTPYGTGPYRFEGYDEGAQILTLTKFAQYREGEPKLDGITFRNIADATARLAALRSGEVDVICDVGGVMPHQAAQILADPNLTLKQRQVSTVHYICMNTREGRLFSDQRMRNALSLCVDRASVVNDLLLGYGKEAVSVLTDISDEWTVDCGYMYDPEQAKQLKEEAVGDETPEAVILVSSAMTGRWPYQDTALLLRAELETVGVAARVEAVDAATWAQRLKDGDYDISLHPFTVSAGEPNYYFTRSLRTGGSNNVARGYGVSDAALDALIAQADTEPDRQARREIYAQMQRLVREEDYMIPIWYDVTLYAMNNRVMKFEIDVQFRPDLYKVDIQ